MEIGNMIQIEDDSVPVCNCQYDLWYDISVDWSVVNCHFLRSVFFYMNIIFNMI